MILSLRIAAGLLGTLLIYMAGFVHEDHEGRLEGWLGTAAHRATTFEDALVIRHRGLVRRSPAAIDAWLNRLLGERLLSGRALLVTSVITAGAGLGLAAGELLEAFLTGHETATFLAYLVLVTAGTIGSAIAGARLGGSIRRPGIVAIGATVIVFVPVGLAIGGVSFLGIALVAVLAVVTTMLVVAGVRVFLRRASAAQSDRRRAALLLAGPILVAVPFCLPLALIFQDDAADALFAFAFAVFWSAPAFLPAVLLLVLQLSLLLHELVWRFMIRPMSRLRPHHVIFEHRTAAFAAGAIMILFAFNPSWFTSNALTRFLGRARG